MDLQLFNQDVVAIVDKLHELETGLVEAEYRLRQQKMELEFRKAGLLTQEDGPINGRNESVRNAQLLQHVGPEELQVLEAEAKLKAQQVERNYWQRLLDIQMAVVGAQATDTIADVVVRQLGGRS